MAQFTSVKPAVKQAAPAPLSQNALNVLYAAGGAGRGALYGGLLGALGGGAHGAYDPGGYVGLDKGGNPVLKRRSRLMGALQNILPGLRTGAVAGGLAGAGYGYATAPSSDQVSISLPSPPPGPVLKKASARAFGAKVAFKLSPEVMQGGLGGAALGAGIGGLAGLLSPGEDENGKKRNRLSAALSGALGGAGIGGLGGAAVGGFSPDTVRHYSAQLGNMFRRPAPAPAPGQVPLRNPVKSPADYAQPGAATNVNAVMGKMKQDPLSLDTTQLPAGSAYSRLSDAPTRLPAMSFGQELAKLKQLPQVGAPQSPLSAAPAYKPPQTQRQLPYHLSQAVGEEPMTSLFGQQEGGAVGSSVSNLEMQRLGNKARALMQARQNEQAQLAAAEQAAAQNAAFQQRIRMLYPGISEEDVNAALASGSIR